ncbi:hypothetical protein [Ekhidna sp.]|uniref:hypothetical protein n=1 Tax=Ekhidna sp. TaxID=2608089 RepID=UPI003CCBDFAC
MSMYCLVWKYKVSNQAKFEEEYGRNGSWFKFFEACEDYLGHDVMKSADGSVFIIVDKWMSKADYQDFIDDNKAEYDSLNEKMKDLYDEETQLGEFDLLQ